MKLREILVICLICSAWVNNAVRADEPVTIESLLREMVDRDAVARYPESDFRLKQHSSYNRVSKTPDDPKGWFANGDLNRAPNGKNFIRTEENKGMKEWVLMDHQGPGAIVRTWMPWRNQNKPETTNRIRIYLDGETDTSRAGRIHASRQRPAPDRIGYSQRPDHQPRERLGNGRYGRAGCHQRGASRKTS